MEQTENERKQKLSYSTTILESNLAENTKIT